jgi:hypothetical protein
VMADFFRGGSLSELHQAMLGDNEDLLLNNDYNQISLSCATPDAGVSNVSLLLLPRPPPGSGVVPVADLPLPLSLQAARTSGTAGCTLSSSPRASTLTPACALRTAAAPPTSRFEGRGRRRRKTQGKHTRAMCSFYLWLRL